MTDQRISQKDYYFSIAMMLCSAAALAGAALFGKWLTSFSPLNLLIFIRFFVPFLMLLLVILVLRKTFVIQHWKAHGVRSIFTILSQYCLFYYLTYGNLLNATLLFSTNGLFLPFISYVILRVKIRIRILISIIISFIGVFVILGPSGHLLTHLTVVGLLAGFFGACSQLTFHYVAKRQDMFATNLIMYGLSSFLALLVVMGFGHFNQFSYLVNTIHLWGVGIILLFSFFSLANQMFRATAYKRVNKASSLMPFLYSTIIFSGILDWFIYSIEPTWNSYLGVVLVIVGAILTSIRKVSS